MELDIENKIKNDFGNNFSYAKELIVSFERKYSLSPRVSRCIIYLSEGDIEKLKSNINLAEQDWRDIIYSASESDIDFNKEFQEAPR